MKKNELNEIYNILSKIESDNTLMTLYNAHNTLFKHGVIVLPQPYIESADNAITGFYTGTIYNIYGEIIYDDFDNFSSYIEALKFGCLIGLDYLIKINNYK